MKKLTDEEIDSLFKEAAANYEPAYHPSEWEVMNKKLEGKPFRIPTWIIIVGIGSLVFLSGIGVGVWMNNQSIVKTQLPNGETSSLIVKSDSISLQKNIDEIKSKASITAHASSREVVSISANQPPQNMAKETTGLSSASVQQTSNHSFENPVKINRNEKNPDALQTSQSPPKLNDEESPSLDKQPMDNASTSALESASQPQQIQLNETIKPKMSHDSTLVQLNEISKADSSAVTDLKDEAKKSKEDGKWFIKVMASPDNSSINFASTTFAGSNFTALIEYQLNNRWSLSTGFILSNKKYSTDEDVVYSGKKAKGLDGSCQVIDIPITAYYRISTHSRFSFYSGIGISSYLMLSENYKYAVVYNSVSYPYDTKVAGKNNEWFKLINLTLGVNYRITNRWSLQAEPFAKLPIAGIGEGKVMLSSTGLFLGIKYKIH